MIVSIPIATMQPVFGSVIISIKSQTVPCDIVICDAPGEIQSQGKYTDLRRKGEAASRNKCVDVMLANDGKYAVMQDRDGQHIINTNFEEMIALMDSERTIGALSISYPTVPYREHVDMRCCVYRREVLEKLHFDGTQERCCCDVVKSCCDALGLKFRYFDDKARLIHR